MTHEPRSTESSLARSRCAPESARARFAGLCAAEAERCDRPPVGLRRAVERVRREPDLLLAALSEVLTDEEAVAQVLRRSYWHPNGFAKVVFAATDAYTARLHVWPRHRRRKADGNAHGHRWAFASWVIAGRLRESRYTETECAGGPGGPYVRHAYGRDSRDSYLRPGQRVALRMTGSEERAAGTVYDCRHDVVHTVAPAAPGLIATLVLQGRADVPETPVYKPAGAPDEPPHEPLSTDELATIVKTVHEAVQR